MRKTKSTDFALALSDFLLRYLPEQRGLSENTVKSYADAFTLFLEFCESECGLRRENLCVADIDIHMTEHFFKWLQDVRHNSAVSVNQRSAALNSFFKYLQYKNPGYVTLFQQIASIPRKVVRQQPVHHLSLEAVETLLRKPALKTRAGRRDFAIISLLYESAARVSEIADLRVGDVRFERRDATVRLCGKGKKTRIVPLIGDVAAFVKEYLADEEQRRLCTQNEPLFCNRTGEKLSRAGVAYILRKYVEQARLVAPELFPQRVYPHILRHSRAMHWLEAGVDLQYIKDLLGHSEISTTEVYAKLNTEMKRKILEEVYPQKTNAVSISWTDDRNLMDWLQGFTAN